ncbi:MAG: hypothetical protein ABH817_00670 [archaeon]
MVDFENGCSECGTEDKLNTVIHMGKQVKLCNRCMESNQTIALDEPKTIDKLEDIKRSTVKEVLSRMSGVPLKPIEKPKEKVTLDDLWERYKQVKEQKKQVLDVKKFEEDLEQERQKEIDQIKQAVEFEDMEIEPEKPGIKNLFGLFKKREKKEEIPEENL